MKKLKVFMFVALLGAMSFGAFSAYEHLNMSAEEKALLENVEALTSEETNKTGSLYHNDEGTYFCCKRDSATKPCGALDCK